MLEAHSEKIMRQMAADPAFTRAEGVAEMIGGCKFRRIKAIYVKNSRRKERDRLSGNAIKAEELQGISYDVT